MNFQDSIIYKIHGITYSMDAIADKLLKAKHEISYNQLLVMIGIYCGGAVNQKYLEGYTLLTNASISKIISHLLSRGLVTRKESKTNRRENTIELSARGKQLTTKCMLELDVEFTKHLSSLKKEDIKSLSYSLGQILNNINSEQ